MSSTSASAAELDAPVAGQERHFNQTDALALVNRLLVNKHLDEAERICVSIVNVWPTLADGWNMLGIVRSGQNRDDQARQCFERAIELSPQASGPHNNLGNVQARGEQIDAAVQSFEHALALAGNDHEAVDAHCNLARMQRKRGDLPGAEAHLRQAICLQPNAVIAWYNLAIVLIKQSRIHEGILANSKAITFGPRHSQRRDSVIHALLTLGELEEASKLYREWLAEEPDNEIIKHHLAGCEGLNTPPRASDRYVEIVFDDFAKSFDQKLTSLQYRAPELVVQALAEVRGPAAGGLDIADIGCGTGWCGPLVKPWAHHLSGCDLSAGMLAKASERAVYDQLDKAELVAYLQARPAAFDVLISADTLCYFGDLTAVLQATASALRPGGQLIYSVEALTEQEGAAADAAVIAKATAAATATANHRLSPSGRYAHSRSHLVGTANAAGLAVHAITGAILRSESGVDVQGWLVTLMRP